MKKLRCTASQYKTQIQLCFVLGIVFIWMLNTLFLFRPIPPDFWGTPVLSEAEASPLQQNLSLCSMDANAVNILLIGQDRRENEMRARSDCMILCTFHPGSPVFTMTSFLRDLYVDIPGYGKNRINAAYAFGGMHLLRQTLQANFGLSIDGCIEVDFCRFPALIDLMGGVTIALRQDEADSINGEIPGSTLQPGSNLLNGAQALAYARIRDLDPDGDFSRTNRHRNILTALLGQIRSSSLPGLVKLFKEAAAMISTDIRQAQLLSLVTGLSSMLSGLEVVSQRIPIEGSYSHQIMDGMAVLVADMDANRAFLRESLEHPGSGCFP